jgi:hypothetical protein
VTGRYRSRLFKHARKVLEPGEAPLAAVRAVLPPGRDSKRYNQSGWTAGQVASDTGVALGLDNALVLTDRRILNFKTGFFNRIDGVRGELPLSRILAVEESGEVITGRTLTFTLRDAKPLTLAIRRHDDDEHFVALVRARLLD